MLVFLFVDYGDGVCYVPAEVRVLEEPNEGKGEEVDAVSYLQQERTASGPQQAQVRLTRAQSLPQPHTSDGVDHGQ